MTFSVATFNVHMWADGDYTSNYDRVLKLVKKHDPDILCLQECGREYNSRLSEESDYKYFASRGGNGIFSKLEIMSVYDFNGKRDIGEQPFPRSLPFITIGVSPNKDKDASSLVYVTCVHLNYRDEPIRLKEIESIKNKLDTMIPVKEGIEPLHIWTGDFNALTKEDYTSEEWQTITDIRKQNNWESPQVDVTKKVKEFGMLDCWERTDESTKIGPLKTCRFNTRIDYVFTNESWKRKWKLMKLENIDDSASDHNMVIGTFENINV